VTGRAGLVLVLLAVTPVIGARAQDRATGDSVPARGAGVHAGLFVLQGIAGVGGGFVGAVALGAAGAAVIGPHGGEDPGVLGAFIGGLVGCSLGMGVGVSTMARSQGEPSSFARASMGAFLGIGLVAGLSGPLDLDPDYASFWIALATIPPALAVLVNHAGPGPARADARLIARPLAAGRLGLGASLGF